MNKTTIPILGAAAVGAFMITKLYGWHRIDSFQAIVLTIAMGVVLGVAAGLYNIVTERK